MINPFWGCAHGCRHCYAVFMRKYSRQHHSAPWGSFVELKINIAEVVRAELRWKRRRGRVLLSSVLDPYQPLEHRCRLTRGYLEALRDYGWRLDILTRSPLVNRDLDIPAETPEVTVGRSILTDNDSVRRVLEPHSPPLGARLTALNRLHLSGIHTWVSVAPNLPMNPTGLYEALEPDATHLLVDPLHCRRQIRDLLVKNHRDYELTEAYAVDTRTALLRLCDQQATRN